VTEDREQILLVSLDSFRNENHPLILQLVFVEHQFPKSGLHRDCLAELLGAYKRDLIQSQLQNLESESFLRSNRSANAKLPEVRELL